MAPVYNSLRAFEEFEKKPHIPKILPKASKSQVERTSKNVQCSKKKKTKDLKDIQWDYLACLFLRYVDYVNQLNVNTVNIYQIGIFADVKMCHNSYLKQTIFGFELYFFSLLR